AAGQPAGRVPGVGSPRRGAAGGRRPDDGGHGERLHRGAPGRRRGGGPRRGRCQINTKLLPLPVDKFSGHAEGGLGMKLLPFLAAGLMVPAAALGAPPAGSDEIRAIWVTRFEYQTESDVKAIVANCAALGFNTILFQVRGQADAYYRSSIEPWAERLGGRDPGFDPLEVAC